jgi:hypothetical protein
MTQYYCNLCQSGDIADEYHYLLKYTFFEAEKKFYQQILLEKSQLII